MFIELLFATTLDMSLPEFQPMEDISGNVIVSDMEDVSGDIIAAEIPLVEIPLEETFERSLQGLSLETEPTGNDSKVSLGEVIRSSETTTINSSSVGKRNISTYHMQIRSTSDESQYLSYIYLTGGVEYTLYDISHIYYSYSTSVLSTVYEVTFSNTFTPSENCYLLKNNGSFYVTYNTGSGDVSGDEPGGDVSGDEPGGDVSGGNGGNVNVDLTNVESKIDNVIVLQRSILMTLLVSFLFPIIKSCVNLLKGGKDV